MCKANTLIINNTRRRGGLFTLRFFPPDSSPGSIIFKNSAELTIKDRWSAKSSTPFFQI